MSDRPPRRQSDRLAGNPAPFAEGLPDNHHPPPHDQPSQQRPTAIPNSDSLSTSTSGGYLSTTNEFSGFIPSPPRPSSRSNDFYNDDHISVSDASSDADLPSQQGYTTSDDSQSPIDMFNRFLSDNMPKPTNSLQQVPPNQTNDQPSTPPFIPEPTPMENHHPLTGPFLSEPTPIDNLQHQQQHFITMEQFNQRMDALQHQHNATISDMQFQMKAEMDRNVQILARTIAQQLANVVQPTAPTPAPPTMDLLDLQALTAATSSTNQPTLAPTSTPASAPSTSITPGPVPVPPSTTTTPAPLPPTVPPPAPTVLPSAMRPGTSTSTRTPAVSFAIPPTTTPPTSTLPIHPSTSTSTSTPSTLTTSISSSDVAALLSHSKDSKQLYFSSFKPDSMDYLNWKSFCALQCRTHAKHKDLTVRTSEGKIVFNDTLTPDQNESLFMMTWLALGKENENFQDVISVDEGDGLLLWKLLDTKYIQKDTAISNQDRLENEYIKLRRESNETFDQFALRFIRKQKELKKNEVEFSTKPIKIAHKFLHALNVPVINRDIVLHLSNLPEWYINITVSGIADKAMKYLQNYEHTTGEKVLPKFSTNSSTSTKSTEKSTSTTKKDTDNPSTRRVSDESKVNSYMTALNNARDKTNYLKSIKTRDAAKFKSLEMKHACTNLNIYDIWRTVANGDTTNTAPAPAPASNTNNNNNSTNNTNNTTPSDATARRVQQDQTTALTNQIQAVLRKALGEQSSQLMQQMQSMGGGQSTSNANGNDATAVEDNADNTSSTDYLPISSTTPIDLQYILDSITPWCNAIAVVQARLQSCQSTRPLSHCISNSPPIISHCKYTPPSHSVNSHSSSTIVADSGATDDMSADLTLFDTITMFPPTTSSQTPHVLLGDDTTKLPVAGYGYMHYRLGPYSIRRRALYVPDLGPTTLLSIKQHMLHQGNYFHAENNTATLAFPSFQVDLRIHPEIHHPIKPLLAHHSYDYNEETATLLPTAYPQHAQKYNLVSSRVAQYLDSPSDQAKFQDTVQFKKLISTAHLPQRATSGAIGYDVVAPTSHTIPPNSTAIIPTGLSSALPPNLYIRIASRSSLAKRNVNVVAGVIDSDYRGEIGVMLRNDGTTHFTIDANTRMAQFIFEKAATPLIEVVDHLPPTARNMGGYGSTGSKARRVAHTECFRLDSNFVLLINNNNPWRPTARRVRCPLETPNLTPTDTPSEEEVDKDPPIITTHKLNSKESTPVDSILDPSPEPIPTAIDVNTSSPTTDPVDPTPRPLPEHQVNSATPNRLVLSHEAIHRAIGFTNATALLKNIHKTGKGNVHIQNLQQPHHLDPGEVASLRSSPRNTTPLQPPPNYSDIWHMDIGFGPCSAIGGIRYTLLLVDKYSKFKFVYGLKNLTTSVLEAMKKFLRDVGITPNLIRTDFDYKLMGGEVEKLLTDAKVRIESAPPKRQDENGLVERHWQTVVTMARNWLTSSQLPTKYWFFAIKRACEVNNMLPFQRDGKVHTPYELVYKEKVDYRNLLPMFSVAYIRQQRFQNQHKNKWLSKTLKCILVGKCSRSDSLLFYHPPSKQTLSCADGYRFDIYTPAGPHFGETYDGDFIFNTKSDIEDIHQAPSHQENSVCFVPDEDDHTQYHRALILTVPIKEDSEPYTIQEIDSGNIREIMSDIIHDHDPTASIDIPTNPSSPIITHPWIHHNAKVTMYLPHLMPRPKRGFLHCESTTSGDQWSFIPGRNKTNAPIKLPHFINIASSLVDNKKLFKGWIRVNQAITARRIQMTSNIIAQHIASRKVSARDLIVPEAPASLLQHSKMHPDDKATWDESYRQEYQGLMDIDTWEVISEEEYQESKHLFGSLLPTMAIAVIKPDGDGNPERAKYRIVALGNLDPHNWTKDECFAPVLSQLELRFLAALAAQNKCIPQSGDITQAFCQSYLPPGEDYICRPPAGCPLTPKGTYWRLKKTLYGLKRSPRHFYNLAVKSLKAIGLQQHPFAPCIFHGTLLEGEPPIYVGIYVDDFIYFSSSKKVEEMFEKKFGAKIPMEFNGDITYFLGINFKCQRHPDDNVSIFLSQQAFIENLATSAGLNGPGVNSVNTPYRSGLPVDKIPIIDLPEHEQHAITQQLRHYVGSFNWLSTSTRPDISTITNMLAQYANIKASPGHIDQAKRIIKYLNSTKTHGILFSSIDNEPLSSFVKFPVPTTNVIALTDANWGPQDQSKPKPGVTEEIELFKSRSVSGYLIWFGGPLHWSSKRQSITARSSAEAEIYATDECTKQLIHLSFIVDGLNLTKEVMPSPTMIYNDNMACVLWSKATSTKGLRHIQIRENAIRESVASDFISINHVEGKVNLADLFTKEDKDTEHFITVRDQLMATGLPDLTQPKCRLVYTNSFPLSRGDSERRASPILPHLTELSQGGVKLGVGPSLSLANASYI